MKIEILPIGKIFTPYKKLIGMPIQTVGAIGIKGKIQIFKKYKKGLKDLEGFSHIILIYHFHKSKGYKLVVTPFLDSTSHGVFSTRAPRRPNAIGISIVKLLSIDNCTLTVENVDILNGTPLLDIKPYVPEFDIFTVAKKGWLKKSIKKTHIVKSDKRFL